MRKVSTYYPTTQQVHGMGNENATVQLHGMEASRNGKLGNNSMFSESRRQSFQDQANLHLDYMASDSPVYTQQMAGPATLRTNQSAHDTSRGDPWN